VTPGETQIEQFAQAMLHEMAENAYKGDWLQTAPGAIEPTALRPDGAVALSDEELLTELLYHAAKLGLALRAAATCGAPDDVPAFVKETLLEYAADVANQAWFVTDKHDALRAELRPGTPAEYEYGDGSYPMASAEVFAGWKTQARELARALMRQPIDPNLAVAIGSCRLPEPGT
jgi:hypothetical protein